MSWLVVFASCVLPIMLLFILLVMDRLPKLSRTMPSLLGIQRRDGADIKDGRRRPLTAGEIVTERRRL